MSNLSLSPRWNAAINQVEIDEPVLGGDGGNANLATRQLGENIFFLKGMVDDNSSRLDDHEAADDPHTQYLLKADFFSRFNELEARVAALEGGSTLATPIAVYAVNISGRAESGNYDRDITFTVTEQSGLLIAPDSISQAQVMSLNEGQPRNYGFTFELPPEYDPLLHRVSVIGGSSFTLNEAEKTVRILQQSTGSKKWSSFSGGYWHYKAFLNGSFRIELYEKPTSE